MCSSGTSCIPSTLSLITSTGGLPLQSTAEGCMLGYDNPSISTICTSTHNYPVATSSLTHYNSSTPSLDYTGYGQPTTCSSFNYMSPPETKIQVPDIGLPPVPQPSPPSYYSPPAAMQVPVEGTISTADCHYNYYTYGVSPSPSHPQTSPLSSHHSSPIIHRSPPAHTSAAMHSPLM